MEYISHSGVAELPMGAESGAVDTASPEKHVGSVFSDSPSRKPRRQNTLESSYSWLLLGLDCFVITLLFASTVWLRYEESLLQAWSLRVYTVLLVTSCLGVYMIGGYHHTTIKKSLRYATEHILISLGILAAAFIAIYAFIAYGKNMRAARTSVTFVLIVFPIVSLAYRRFLDPRFRRAITSRCINIIGAGKLAGQLAGRLAHTDWGYRVRVFDESPSLIGRRLPSRDDNPCFIEDASILPQLEAGELANTEAMILTKSPSALGTDLRQHLLRAQYMHGLHVYTYDSYMRSHFRAVPVELLSYDWAFTEGFQLNRSASYERVKRVTDLLGSLFMLLLLTPLMAVIALLVKLTSPGPVFFRQERVGRCEQPFTLLKFRSMSVGSEEGNAYTEDNDARITRVGAFLRRTHLDELPQLFNVLRGEMSLVGSRAEWRRLVDDYEQSIPHYHYRHLVKPGVTGWAQVNYPYGQGEEDAVEKLKYDLYYVRYCSFFLDISTLLKTAYTVLFAKGR